MVLLLYVVQLSCGGRRREYPQRKGLGGCNLYLEGIVGNPSLVTILRQQKQGKQVKRTRKPPMSNYVPRCSLCRPPFYAVVVVVVAAVVVGRGVVAAAVNGAHVGVYFAN